MIQSKPIETIYPVYRLIINDKEGNYNYTIKDVSIVEKLQRYFKLITLEKNKSCKIFTMKRNKIVIKLILKNGK